MDRSSRSSRSTLSRLSVVLFLLLLCSTVLLLVSKHCSFSTEDRFLDALLSGDVHRRNKAVEKLGHLRNVESVPVIIESLARDIENAWHPALGEKSSVGWEFGVHCEYQEAVARSINRMGRPGVLAVLSILNTGKRFRVAGAARVLGSALVVAERVVEAELLRGLTASDYYIRTAAAFALGDFASRVPRGSVEQEVLLKAVDPLIVGLNDEHAALRRFAAFALAGINPKAAHRNRAVTSLISLLKRERDLDVRWASISALRSLSATFYESCWIDTKSIREAFFSGAGSTGFRELMHASPFILMNLKTALDKGDASTRLDAVSLIEKHARSTFEGLPLLEKARLDPDETVHSEAEEALRRLKEFKKPNTKHPDPRPNTPRAQTTKPKRPTPSNLPGP